MKHFFSYILFLFLFLHQIVVVSAQNTKKVLFLGNSYTYENNLPQMIANAALSVGDTLIFDSYTPGGYTLLQHSTSASSQSKIMAGGWHHVVLQGQSQEPITHESNFYTGATNLNALIKQYNPCSVPLFYMTWGRKNGDAANCPNIPVMCTYEGMDTTIKQDYMILANWLRTEISPVSVVWKYLRYNHPGINLYQADESHPSAAGSYAAACCFYAAIFKKDPTLITYNFGLNPANAAIIRNVAKKIVFDSLSLWNYKQLPVSTFSYKTGAGTNEVIFSNTSQGADQYLWNFGDNTTSSLKSPTHSYASNGTYTVTLTSSNCDLQGVHKSVKDTSVSFCIHTPHISPDTLKLCPGESDTLWTEPGNSYQWYNDGIPIPGANKQYLIVSRAFPFQVVDFPAPSVLTSNAGCPELSKESLVKDHRWENSTFLIHFDAIGNVMNGNKVCIGETLKLVTFFGEDHITQWYKNGVAIPSANRDTFIIDSSGTYKVRITHPMCSNMGSYSDSIHYEFISCTSGLPDNGLSPFQGVYPNPVSEFLTIQFKNTIKKDQLQIFNSVGVLIKETEVSQSVKIDVSDLENGLYFIRLKDKPQHVQKFIKQ